MRHRISAATELGSTPPPRFSRALTSTPIAVAAVHFLLLAVATAFLMGIGDAGGVAEAQSSQTTHQVTPATFGTYFDIDATSSDPSAEVATLKSAYKSNVELIFGAGSYTNGIKIEGARNVTLRGANSARSANAAIIKPYKPIVSAEGATRQSTFEVSGSTDVTVSGFRFDFACVYDETITSRDSTLTPVGVHYRLHGIMYRDSSGVIADNFIGNYYDMWTPLGLIVKPNPPGNDGNELGITTKTRTRPSYPRNGGPTIAKAAPDTSNRSTPTAPRSVRSWLSPHPRTFRLLTLTAK